MARLAAFARQPRSATVEAAEPCELVEFDGSRTREVLRNHPSLREYVGHLGIARAEENLGRMIA